MATKKKISRKEIKQPDEFITLSGRAIEFARTHSREVIIGVASLIALGLILWAWSVYSAKQEDRASRFLAEAQSLLHPASPATETGRPPGDAETKTDPEAAARALVLLQDLVENYKRTEASGVARLLLGQCYYQDGNYDAAIDTYQVSLRKSRKPELKAMAQEGLAYSYEAKEDFARALTCYEKLSRTPRATMQGWAYMGMARCYERLGEAEKAIDAYRTLLAEHPQHPKAQEARASIARLTQSTKPEAPGVKNPD